MTATPTLTEKREHLFKLLKQFNTAMLVTRGDEDHLRVRPMAIAQVEDNGQIWFVTSADTAKAHEVEHDSRVHIVCQNDHRAYLSIGGRAQLSHDRVKLGQVWNEMMRVWFPAGKEDPNVVLIAVTPDMGEFWDNAGVHKFKYLFESARAYVTGTKPEIEEGEEHALLRL